MFWMPAYPSRGHVGGGWALEFESYLGPVKWPFVLKDLQMYKPTSLSKTPFHWTVIVQVRKVEETKRSFYQCESSWCRLVLAEILLFWCKFRGKPLKCIGLSVNLYQNILNLSGDGAGWRICALTVRGWTGIHIGCIWDLNSLWIFCRTGWRIYRGRAEAGNNDNCLMFIPGAGRRAGWIWDLQRLVCDFLNRTAWLEDL